LKRSRALEAIGAVERRCKAEVAAAAGVAHVIAGHRRRNHTAIGWALQSFNTRGPRSAFACAAAGSHQARLAALDIALAHRQREADERVNAARDAVLAWAHIRCGLERRRIRSAAKS
jgi:hypothetical protein